MQSIAIPKKVKYEKGKEEHRNTIIVEPCYPGYGITLGNSIRRVLLSSLPGSAVVGVKINNADHEFTSIEYLKEDVLELVMNLKSLRMKVHGDSDEIVKLNLKIHGEKVITAGDIEKNSSVEIINSDLVLGNITDMAGNIELEIYVAQGIGYETTDMREKNKNKEVGYIEIDSIFSPVVSVGLNVENMRVGKMTNWDKLIIDLKTDGTVSPENAFEDAVKILIKQFNALLNEDKKRKEEE